MEIQITCDLFFIKNETTFELPNVSTMTIQFKSDHRPVNGNQSVNTLTSLCDTFGTRGDGLKILNNAKRITRTYSRH